MNRRGRFRLCASMSVCFHHRWWRFFRRGNLRIVYTAEQAGFMTSAPQFFHRTCIGARSCIRASHTLASMRPLSRSPYGRKCKPFVLKTIKDWVRRADRAVKPKPSCVDCCLHRTARRCSRPLRENRAARGIAITSQRGIGALARAQARWGCCPPLRLKTWYSRRCKRRWQRPKSCSRSGSGSKQPRQTSRNPQSYWPCGICLPCGRSFFPPSSSALCSYSLSGCSCARRASTSSGANRAGSSGQVSGRPALSAASCAHGKSGSMKLIQQAGAAALQRRTGETGVKFTTFIPARFKKRGACTVIVPAQADAAAQASPFVSLGKFPPSCDTALLIALGRAFHWQRLLDEGIAASGSEIAQREALHPSTVNELLRLNLLAPDIVEALIAGRQPKTMTLLWFQRNPLPVNWERQCEIVAGFGR